MERYKFDENQPQSKMSLLNFRNSFRALHEGDFLPMRPVAEFVLDDMEYGTNARAQANWSDFVEAVVKPSTTKSVGNYALEVSDCGIDDVIQQSRNMNLSGYSEVKFWIRQDLAGSPVKFFVKDSNANKASWTVDAVSGISDTFASELITLASPDTGAADLSDVTKFGFSDLVSDTQYIIDDVRARVGMAVAVESASCGGYYENVYRKSSRVAFTGGPSPTIVAPVTNPRIDLLFYSSDLYWRTGTAAVTPAYPTVPTGIIPICFVYCKPTMTRVVDYENKDAYTDEGYILKDIRPLYNWGISNHGDLTELGSDTHTQYIKVAGTRAFTGDQSLGSNKLTHLKKASGGSDAVRFDQLSDAISYKSVGAWLVCDGNGIIRQSYNVTSVTNSADGKYHVVMTTPMATSDFAVIATADMLKNTGLSDANLNGSEFTVCVSNSSDTLVDADVLSICVFGS